MLSSDSVSRNEEYCPSCVNLVHNKHKGDVSPHSRKRLLNAIDWLFLLATNKTAFNERKKSWFNFKVAMLTLSLPCQQLHSDLYVKNKMLNSFLQELRVKYGLKNYAWRAEKKLNGTIHFHIILDIYVHYATYNRIWNKVLDNHGYIEQYRRNQLAYHAHGFNYNPSYWVKKSKKGKNHYDHRDYYDQLKAYKKGMRENWTQPTGTSDVHGLRGIKDSRLYMGKYVTKKIDIAKGCDYYKKRISENKVDPMVFCGLIESIEDISKNKLTVQGNIWYISESLSKMKSASTEVNSNISAELSYLYNRFPNKVEQYDHCIKFCFSMKELISLNCKSLTAVAKSYVTKLRDEYYPPGHSLHSNLGYCLKLFDN
jgi:hypothetical protein